MSNYSGIIIADPSGTAIEARDIELLDEEIAKGVTLRYVGSDFGIKVWGEYVLHSMQPLADEEWSAGGFDYKVYIVRGRARLIVLAPRKAISEYVWNRVLQSRVGRVFRVVNVLVPQLVEFCSSPGAEFLITSLFGDYSGSTTYVRRISIYGDEVTKSAMYEDFGTHFNFYRCGLGRRLFDGMPRLKPNEEGEIVQLRSTGSLSMELRNRRDAHELINVINFVMLHRWVEDWVPE